MAEAWLLQPVICSEGGIWCGWQAEVHCVCGGGAGQDSCLLPNPTLEVLGINQSSQSFSSLPQGGHHSTSAEERDTSPKFHLPDCLHRKILKVLVSLQAVKSHCQCNYPILSSLKERRGKSASPSVKTANLFLRLHGKCIIPNSIR